MLLRRLLVLDFGFHFNLQEYIISGSWMMEAIFHAIELSSAGSKGAKGGQIHSSAPPPHLCLLAQEGLEVFGVRGHPAPWLRMRN